MKKCFIMVLSLTAIFLVACKGKKLIDKQELASQEWVLSEFKNGDTTVYAGGGKIVESKQINNIFYRYKYRLRYGWLQSFYGAL